MSRIPLLLALSLSVATSLFAAEDPLAFGKGPAKWIMTREEERAWRDVKTVDEARNFAALFWARRDPTPGTFDNEFRADYEGRVIYADKQFKEGKIRGSMTERGRVLLVLGFPSNLSEAAAKYQKQESAPSVGNVDITGGRQLSGKDVWLWNFEDAKKKFDMPKVEVVFLHDPQGVRRDPQRADFIAAMPVAIRNAIKSPDLKEVPEWAKPQVITAPSNVVLRVEREADAPAEPIVTTTTTVIPAKRPVALPRSAGKLTLVRDAFAIDPQTKNDPFGGLSSLESYKRGDELNFIAEYCAGVIVEELSGVTVQAKISGMINGEKINLNGPVDELIPDSIKVSPGCHLVRGLIPLAEVDPGQYTLTLTVAAGADKYNLTREFRVE